MGKDIINETLKTYLVKRKDNLKVIQRYLSMKYKMFLDEKLLEKRLQRLSTH